MYEDGSSLPGRITACDAPALLAFTEDRDELRVELRAEGTDGGATLLVFTHTFAAGAATSPGVPSMATGWDLCLDELWRALAGQPATPADEAAAKRGLLREAYRDL